MKAAVYHGRRDVRIESIPEPGPPDCGELVLEVLRSAICGTDVSEYLHALVEDHTRGAGTAIAERHLA